MFIKVALMIRILIRMVIRTNMTTTKMGSDKKLMWRSGT